MDTPYVLCNSCSHIVRPGPCRTQGAMEGQINSAAIKAKEQRDAMASAKTKTEYHQTP